VDPQFLNHLKDNAVFVFCEPVFRFPRRAIVRDVLTRVHPHVGL
jgi:hypothetical protein